MRYHRLLLLLLCVVVTSARADDSVDAALAGGIVLAKSPEISMQDETLTISKLANNSFNQGKFSIDVDFHFKNTAKQTLTRKIAFVLPPVRCKFDTVTMWRGLESTGPADTLDNGLKDFTVTVDDQSQSYTVRREAKIGERDITDLLTKLKIPLNPCEIKIADDNYPEKQYRAALEQNHLLDNTHSPIWSEHIYFEWQQTFPSNKVVHIHHHYTPVIGQSVAVPYSMTDLLQRFTADGSSQKLLWNRDLSTLIKTNPSLVNTHMDDHQTHFCVAPMWVRYQLTTGANWQHGIESFKLIVNDENGAPFAVNKFYKETDHVQQNNQNNSMTFTMKNFIPHENLFVLFLSLPKTREDLGSCGM